MINTDDKQPSEHSELPWIIEGNRLMDNSGRNTIAVFVQGWSDDDANMQFVKEACNNYETLKAQNERLVKVLEDRFVSHLFGMHFLTKHCTCAEWKEAKTVLEEGQVYEHRAVLFQKIGSGPSSCHWCETPLTWYGENKIIADHLDGDKWNNDPANLVPSCFECNLRRNSFKTHCSRGHPFTPENTYIRPDGGGRQCRICKNDRWLELSERRKRAKLEA